MPFPDHHPPPLDLYLKLVEMIDNWLRADDNHVAVVHCKGGKGRTGTVIVSLLYFRGECATVEEAEQLFASMRSSKSKGVTQPSQRRYIQYFKTILVRNQFINYQPIRLRSVTIAPLLSERPILLQIFNGVTDDAPLIFSQMRDPIAFNDSTSMVKYNIELDVRGDLYFKVFRRRDKEKVERAFHVVMHSYFITSTQYILERPNLDHLKTSDRRFNNDLTMTFQFAQPQTARLYPNADDLHERMTRKYVNYLSSIPASIAKRRETRTPLDSQFSQALGSSSPHSTVVPNGDSSSNFNEDLPTIGLMNHPLVSTHVKYAIQASSVESPSPTTPRGTVQGNDFKPASAPVPVQKTPEPEDDMMAPPDEPPPLPPSSKRDSWAPRRPSLHSLHSDTLIDDNMLTPPEATPKPPSGRTLGQFRQKRKSQAFTNGQIRRSGDPNATIDSSSSSATSSKAAPSNLVSQMGARPASPSIGAPSMASPAPASVPQKATSPPSTLQKAPGSTGWAPASPSTNGSSHLTRANRFTTRNTSATSLTLEAASPRSATEISPRATGDSSDFTGSDDSYSSDESDSEEYFDADYIAEVLQDIPLPSIQPPTKHQSEKLTTKKLETTRPTRAPPAPAK